MSVLGDPKLEEYLESLHAQSERQEPATYEFFRQKAREGTLDWKGLDAEATQFFADKMVALPKDKAEFCYLLCRSLDARRVVEVGTSFGVSTLYLAAAVRDNAQADASENGAAAAPSPIVIGTEHEAGKAAAARANFSAAGLDDYIDLREGDLRETLRSLDGPIDFVLVDIWTEMSAPALRLVAPHMRRGAVAVADNTTTFRAAYADYFAALDDPAHPFRTMTLPFEGGLEVSVRL